MTAETAVKTHTIIIGASSAGLATAACLKQVGIPFLLLEKSNVVGALWRGHYDRLHLHTGKSLSGLPGLPMPDSYPRYPSRDQVVAYLETYAAHHGLEPHFNQCVTRVEKTGDAWITTTQDTTYHAQNVVIATGCTNTPYMAHFPGDETFTGDILHSSEYKNGKPYSGKRVLVVGFGNSGGEIAIDLTEHGAQAALAVRSAVNIIPRDLLGIPILSIGIVMNLLPPRIADMLSYLPRRLSIGDITRYGLQQQPYGPNVQIKQDGRIPLLDIGTMKLIRQGKISVFPGIKSIEEDSVHFVDDRQEKFDAIIMATGYRPNLSAFLPAADTVCEDGLPINSGEESALKGLYFCGFYVSPTGMLREAGLEAKRISRAIKNER